jgi:hypothetical protein
MKIIGGMFGLEDLQVDPERHPFFLTGKYLLLASARSGIRLVVNKLRPKNVWLPSYLCDVIVQAVQPTVSPIRFYEIGYDLKIPSVKWVDDIQAGDLVLFIAYFGFPIDNNLTRLVKEHKAWVMEDASQALLSKKHDPNADFLLYSPKKFLGVPDGSILVLQNPVFEFEGSLEGPPPTWWISALKATILKREFDKRGGERDWFELYQQSDLASPYDPFRMSELSELIIRYCIDEVSISEVRVANYMTLLDELREFALFQDLPDGIVPLGFPIRLENRDQVLLRMFERNIYPPIHWDLRGLVPARFKESHRLSHDIMTLICDQRYDEDDMKMIVRQIR